MELGNTTSPNMTKNRYNAIMRGAPPHRKEKRRGYHACHHLDDDITTPSATGCGCDCLGYGVRKTNRLSKQFWKAWNRQRNKQPTTEEEIPF